MRIPKYRPPTHPGEMLLKEFLEPMQITQQALSQALGVPYQRINELVNQKRGVTPSTALRLAKFLATVLVFGSIYKVLGNYITLKLPKQNN